MNSGKSSARGKRKMGLPRSDGEKNGGKRLPMLKFFLNVWYYPEKGGEGKNGTKST